MLDLVPSRYNVLVPLTDGRALAYNSSCGGLAIWSAQERSFYDRMAARDPEVELQQPMADDMLAGGYLVHRGTDELSVLEEQYVAHRSDPRAMSLTIAPTLACNFGCDYCYQGEHKPGESMGPAVQDAIIALIESAAAGIGRLGVTWYGGEPLLRKPLVRELSARIIGVCDERGIGYSAAMVSNGYLLDAETARWLYERHVRKIQITLDGAAAAHDRRRHLLGGQGTFGRIAENLQAVVEATPDLRLWIRVNIDRRNQDQIHALVDHMDELGLGGRPNLKLYFSPVTADTESCHAIHDVCMEQAAYGALETELYRHAYDKGLSNLPYPGRFSGSCAAVSPRGYVIAPNGDVHKCWDTIGDPHEAVGSLFDMESVVQNPLTQRWNRWTPFDSDSCRNCRLLPSCAGGCAHRFIYANEASRLPCPSWKHNLKEQLILRAEKMGAIGPGDFDAEATRTDPEELWVEPAARMKRAHTTARIREPRRLPVLS